MSTSFERLSVLSIINEVEKKLGLNVTADLTNPGNDLAPVLLQLLNDVVEDCINTGDWREFYTEVTISAVSSTKQYSINASAPIHHIYEVAYTDRIAPLHSVPISDIKRLNRLSSFGTPNQYCLVSVDASANPVMEVYPVPTNVSGKAFTVSLFKKPARYTTADGATIPDIPANTLIKGLHAAALLEENGGEPTREYQMTLMEYQKMKSENLNRYTTDQGTSVRLRPARR